MAARALHPLAAILCSAVLCTSGFAEHVPITAWSSQNWLPNTEHNDVVPTGQALKDLVLGATGGVADTLSQVLAAGQQTRAQVSDAVAVFVTEGPADAALTGAVSRLAAAAASSLKIPRSAHEGDGSPPFTALHGQPNVRVMGACGGNPAALPATADAVREHLAAGIAAGQPAVAVVCSSGAKAAALLEEVQAALAALTDKHTLVHVEAVPTLSMQQRRLLMLKKKKQYSANDDGSSNSSGPPYTTCDATCQRDVKFFEGIIVFVVLALALSVGLFCMHCIDPPTKFPHARDLRSHQD